MISATYVAMFYTIYELVYSEEPLITTIHSMRVYDWIYTYLDGRLYN